DCGQEIEAQSCNLGTSTFSCGCLQRERAAQANIQRLYRHGEAGRNTTPLYRSWGEMKDRCLNPQNKRYKDYGVRGIKIAPKWINDYPAFRNYINQNLGPRPSSNHTIDRIDNDGNYEPGNLRWSTRSEQQQNSRRSKLNKTLDALLADRVNKSARQRRPHRQRK